MLKIKNDIPFENLSKYGFEADQSNCEHPADHYYHLNNWFNQISPEFRITVNMLDRHIEILSLGESGLRNVSNIETLYRMAKDGIIEES